MVMKDDYPSMPVGANQRGDQQPSHPPMNGIARFVQGDRVAKVWSQTGHEGFDLCMNALAFAGGKANDLRILADFGSTAPPSFPVGKCFQNLYAPIR